MKYLIIIASASLTLLVCKTKQTESQVLINPIVKTQNGLLQGEANETNSVVAFKGIPYAADDTPFMTGLNADETRFTGDQNDVFKALYPSNTKEEAAAALKLAGQEQNRLSAYLWLNYRAKTAKTNGYIYYFDRAIPWPEHPEFGVKALV